MNGETFLERIFVREHDKMCSVITRYLYERERVLDFDELRQEAFDIWWETFDRLNSKFKKGLKIKSDDHAKNILYRMFPFTVSEWAQKRRIERCFLKQAGGIKYIHPVHAEEKERTRKRDQPGSPEYEKRRSYRRERAKRMYWETKKDPTKYRAALDYKNNKRNEAYLLKKLGKYVDARKLGDKFREHRSTLPKYTRIENAHLQFKGELVTARKILTLRKNRPQREL